MEAIRLTSPALGTSEPGPTLARRVHAFELLQPGKPGYTEACRYIQQRFQRLYNAHLSHFMPLIAVMHRDGVMKATAGLRQAAPGQPLFIEYYLDAPVEEEIAQRLATPAYERHGIAEIGNLAATGPGAIPGLFTHYAALLEAMDVGWLTCNATPQVQAIIQHLGLPFHALARAERNRVPNADAWGQYYDQPSCVMAAPTAGILAALDDHYRGALAHARKAIQRSLSDDQ